ncbi:MAG: hypothetical protein ACRD11_15160 [Terriglobia bacterium]
MKRTFRRLVYAALAAVALSLLAALATAGPRQRGPLTLTLVAPSQPLTAGQPLLLRVTVGNTSDRTRYVPVTRGVFWIGAAYHVHVLDRRGRPAPPAQRLVPKKGVVVLGGGSSPSRRLKPGKSLSDLVNVTSLYDLSRPGKYKIWIAEPISKNTSVRSNTVTVTVVK